jgi:hypothetical protein
MPSHDKTQRATCRDALRLISHKHDYTYSLQSTLLQVVKDLKAANDNLKAETEKLR